MLEWERFFHVSRYEVILLCVLALFRVNASQEMWIQNTIMPFTVKYDVICTDVPWVSDCLVPDYGLLTLVL